MDESYTLAAIEAHTGIAYEKLRYVIDQKILPGDRMSRDLESAGSQGRGIARTYSAYCAFGIACAALLLAAGLRRATVQKIMDMLCKNPEGKRDFNGRPLYEAFQKRETSLLQVGDLVNVRCRGSADSRKKTLDTGWRQVATGALLGEYEPMVIVTVNAARLRQCFEN